MTDPQTDVLNTLLPPALRAATSPVPLRRAERLFRQGQSPRLMYFVRHGEVALERAGERGEAVVLQCVAHGFVAEASLQAASYHCDARVTRAGEAAALPLERVRATLAQDAAFALRWIAMLGGEVRQLRARCERLSLRGVETRLIHYMKSEGVDGCVHIASGLKSLAVELAVTHEALYRTLARLERTGMVARDAEWLRIPRP